jgi:hypothetical protein
MSEMYATLTEIQEQWKNGEFESELEYENAMLAAQEYYYQ